MSDRHLFYLDADRRWDLAWDSQQWMVRRRQAQRRGTEGLHASDFLWGPVWYVGSEKRTLHQYIEGERGPPLPVDKRPRIVLTAEAQAKLDALPDRFLDWRDGAPRRDSKAA